MRRDALVVGINQYPFLKDTPGSKAKHLKTPAGDAEAIAQLLEEHGDFRVKRLPESVIDGKLQVDPNKTVKKEELETAIANLFLPDSDNVPATALLFFSGHGMRKTLGTLKQGFFAASDASPSKDQWGFSLRDLWDMLRESQIKQQIIWLDCCFSGQLLNFRDTELGRQSSECDRMLMAASRDYEVAYQQLDGKHGVLTGAIVAGLNPNLVPEFEWITNQTLAVAVEHELQKHYKITKIPQFPLINNHGEAIKLIQVRAKPDQTDRHEQFLDQEAGEIFLKNLQPNLINTDSEVIGSIAMVDIDELTIINKHYSRDLGDQVIATVAKIIKDKIKKENSSCRTGRCGDDTFYVFLPKIEITRAESICEQLRTLLANHTWFSLATDLRVTCSFSVAQFRFTEDSQQTIVRAASGLRTAKISGKNIVVRGPIFLCKNPSLNLRDYYS